MKRSQWLKLTLMGAASGSLISCAPEPRQQIVNYSDISDCVNDRVFSEQECVAQYQQAQQHAAQDAPMYQNGHDCQTDFGRDQCYHNGSFWQPFMAGFFMSRLAGSVGSGLRSGQVHSRPLYRSADDPSSFRTAENVKTGNVGDTRPRSAPNRLMSASQASLYSRSNSMGKRAATLNRGGFGQRSSSWGS
ncbi:hypothetical protein GCM10011369_08780 [Neiella marina]|uniref:DUF1190 domain-containing protein n=1 Tax=Neiella marina TaxID=508461 RepID=A0A8J2U3A9_9GAMM|nr:DUF1190 domain-containing protein [Neiella marina]GGA69366.1 hypothetical protein GCM10011369_08780 [Neiella marina]